MGLKYCKLERSVVKLSGADRKKFLHNFCTADINVMNDGDVSEAFILNTKGKIIGLVIVICYPEFIELNTVQGQAAAIIEHLDRYLIREDVELSDDSENRNHLFIYDTTPSEANQKGNASLDDATGIQIVQCEVAGWGRLLSHHRMESLVEYVDGLDVPEGNLDELHVIRIQSGTPWFGLDCTEDNLPQELQRDDKAISFTKGCYLGQETVARIDALGQVNKLLVRVQLAGQVSESNQIVDAGKVVGKITSVVSTGEGQTLGLAIVRRAFSKPGTVIDGEEFHVTVI